VAGTARVGLDLLREVGYDEFNRQSTHNMWMTSWLRKALTEKTCVLGFREPDGVRREQACERYDFEGLSLGLPQH
jgi:hypothetical protein